MIKLLLVLATFAAFSMSTLAADGPVYHVVHFKFKADSKKEDVEKVVAAFAELKTKIPAVQEMLHGTNSSPEGLAKGFTHCWIVTFKNTADRDAYLVHPAHAAFVEVLKPQLEEPMVVDFIPVK
jgi:poly(3-hydroxybutyrate) depolymerase